MNLMGREGGGSSGQSSGGPSQPVYRAMSGAPPPKRAAPGGIQRVREERERERSREEWNDYRCTWEMEEILLHRQYILQEDKLSQGLR